MDVKEIKELVSRVNQTLGHYEKDYISAKRLPSEDPESCDSLEDFLEKRFNFEAYKVPELQKAVEMADGRLFSCVEIENPDVKKRKFKKATIKLIGIEQIPDEFEDLKKEVEIIREEIGGSEICFNSVKRKIKLTIHE